MSSVLDHITCPQCKYAHADSDLNCRTHEEEICCRRCGYRETWTAKYDQDSKWRGWTHEINKGFGALWYQGAIGFAAHFLNSMEGLANAEKWLRERLEQAEVEPDTSYLTRWNHETRTVEVVIGKFYEECIESGESA